jgi:magnesium chelatase subunit D
LLDRFSLAMDVETPRAAEDRALIVESRLRFDADPIVFCAAFEEEQDRLRQAIVDARSLVADVKPSTEILQKISLAVIEAGVRSLRADLATLRASIAHAALDHRASVIPEDIEAVLPLVLHHRAKRDRGHPPTPPPQPNTSSGDSPAGSGQTDAKDQIFPPDARRAPELRVSLADSTSRGRSATVDASASSDHPAGTRLSGGRLDVVASLTQSFRNTGTAALKQDELVFRRSAPASGVRFIFVVDSSGSQAAQQRMRAVKGAAAALLESSVDRKDEVAVISFRGAKAELVLEPCRDAEAGLRVLEFLPTGGRTPLAHALELAAQLVNPASLLILLTDGRANVPSTGADPWTDALAAARNLNCSSVLLNSSTDGPAVAATETLAAAMRARLIHLDNLDEEAVLKILRP